MTRDEIIRMAREAGLFVPQAGIPENGALTRFAALVAAAEREACALAGFDACVSTNEAMRVCYAIRKRSKA